MTGFNHVLTGIGIALTVKNPIFAPILALASHFILDMLPHFGGVVWFEKWGKPLIAMSIVDGFLCCFYIVGAVLLFPQHTVIILLCAAFATLPDWLWILYYKFNMRHSFFAFHLAIQRFERPWGAYVEVAFSCIVVSLLGYVV